VRDVLCAVEFIKQTGDHEKTTRRKTRKNQKVCLAYRIPIDAFPYITYGEAAN
jgi:hypothetical protein